VFTCRGLEVKFELTFSGFVSRTLQKWESPKATQIRVSAEVTAYVAIWDEAN